MKRIASLPPLFRLRGGLVLYVTLAIIISTSNSVEMNKRNGGKMTREKSDWVKNAKESTGPSAQQRGNNRVDVRRRAANESATIGDERSSVALNQFLEDVLKARNRFKWIDRATRRDNHMTLLDDSPTYTKCHSTVSVNTENVLESADIGYKSRLRGKRGFDENYERMWMPRKKKYEEKSTRDVPQRVYLDNDVTFKRDADDADFNIFYRSPATLDRSFYEGEAIGDQPLKDWARKKDLYSSGDWSNFNENSKVTNGESTWSRDYDSTREILANSGISDDNSNVKIINSILNSTKKHNHLDLSKDEERLRRVDDDVGNRLEIVSLYDPTRADDFNALQKSPAIRNRKSQNTPPTLESLKKIVLDLRNSLTINKKKANVLSRESSWWNHPKSAAEISDFERDLDEHPYKETIWRIKRAKNVNDENENDQKISQGGEFEELNFGEGNSKDLHDRAKRSRRSFLTDLNNQKDVLPENKSHREAQIIKDALGNVTRMQKIKRVARLYSGHLNDDGTSLTRTSNKINISGPRYSLDEASFLNHCFINLTITSSVPNEANVSEPRYLSSEANSNNYSIDDASLFLVKMNLQTRSPQHIAANKVARITSKKLGEDSPTEKIANDIDYTKISKDQPTSLNCKNVFVTSNTSVDSTRFSTNDNVADDFGKFAENKESDGEELSARKKSRLGTDDGQSKDTREEFPEGNTSRGFDTAANESRRIHAVETIAAAKKEEIATNGMRKENRELIPGVIKVFEPRERPYQKQKAEARLLGRMRKDGTFVEQTRTSRADESADANAREDSSSSIDLVIDATIKLEASGVNASEIGESIMSKDRREDLVSMTLDGDSRRQQQMVPSPSATNSGANKSNGNSDTGRIDIRVVGSNGNETMNVKEDARAITGAPPREYRGPDNHLRRRLLWISTGSVYTQTEDSSIKSAESVLIENVTNEDRQQSKIINSADSRKLLIRAKREENPALQNHFNPRMSDANRHVRYKRSTYSFDNLESDNAAGNVVVGKEVAVNHDERDKNKEEYENVERVKEDYDDSEEDLMEDNDRAMESERKGRALPGQRIDPVRAKVDMLIRQKLERKNKDKDSDYRRKRRSVLDMIEYYDYDDNIEEQERDAPLNEQEIRDQNDEPLIKDERSEMKRAADGKTLGEDEGLGKKKNENAEAMMKEERERAKNKVPKEQIVVDLGERKNKTFKSDQKDRKPSDASEANFEDTFSGGREPLIEKNSAKVHRSQGFIPNNVYREESTDLKSKWLDQPVDNGMALPKNLKVALNDNHGKKINLHKPLEIISSADVNPDVIENILLDVEPIKILRQDRELEIWKDFYEDFENERPEDRYYYQGNDRRHLNNVEPLYEELKNVYDWPDSELKSGPRLRGDQRLRYESDNKLDTNPSQLQPLNDRFFGSSQSDNEQRRFQLAGASWTSSITTVTNNYLVFKVTNDMSKGDLEQISSTKENVPSIFSIDASTESGVPKIARDENNPEKSAIGWSEVNAGSGSPFENRKYIESETHKVSKGNLNSDKPAAIDSQDLHESFVESLDWHDDFDDNVKIRLGRGLKSVDEVINSDANETRDQHDKSDMTDKKINPNPKLYDSSRIVFDNSSASHDRYNNITANVINVFNVHHDASEQGVENIQQPILMNKIYIVDDDQDLEAAEQKYVNNETTRAKRAAASYRTFYDDVSGSQSDSDEMDNSLSDHFQLSNILGDQPDGVYNAATSLNKDVQDFDRYSQIPRSESRKRESSGRKSKKNEQSSEKHAKKNSSRNGDHHVRSDVSENFNRDNSKRKKNSKVQTSSLTGRRKIQKSKTSANEEAPSEKVLYENAEDQSTVKPDEDDARRKEITLFLAVDNVDDDEQMDVALRGELAGKIVERIFEQIRNNDRLKNVIGPGLARNYKDVIVASNIYRQGLDEDENRTETTMERIKELLGRLIVNEVQRKSCVSLSPDMREFLGWMLEMDREERPLEEVPPLPLIREEIIPQQDPGRKFLFDNASEREDISNLQKKVKVLNTLVKEYNALTAKEKTKVQTVHDYLIRQLNLLLKYIEEREEKEKLASLSIGAARPAIGNILQYQNAMPNVTNASYSMTKQASPSPIDTHNFFRFNNIAPKVTDGQRHHDGHTRRRETRSLEIPSKQRRKTKRQKFHNYEKKKNNRKAKRSRRKHRKHQNHAESSPIYQKPRQKRASREGRDSLYLGYEEPTIYDSFDLLDAKLTGRKKKRKLADKENMKTENDRMLDSLPIKGKNRVEDEVILLNKREAWRKENEKQLEEVAFGKDMRNGTRKEKKRFEKLTEGDKHKPIDKTSSRTKREDTVREMSNVKRADRFDESHSKSEADSGEPGQMLRATHDNDDNDAKDADELRLAERRINVFANNKTDAAIDTATAGVSAREKFVINAGANNQVKGKLCAINRETKIDRANGSTSFVNLTSDTNIGVSKERRKVSAAEKEADDNAVKLNRATNYRSEEMDPEIELKNLKRRGERTIYDVADWRRIDLLYNDDYDDDDLSGNKLRTKYIVKLDVPSDLDPENNFELSRLRNNKWPNDVVEWKLLPIRKSSPRYNRALSRIRSTEMEPPTSGVIGMSEIQPNAYLNAGEFRRLKHRGRGNNILRISPVLRIIDDAHDFSRGTRSKTKLSRSRNDQRSSGHAEVPFVQKHYNRKLREISRSRDDPEELDDRAIYNGIGPRSPVRSHRYYDDYANSPTLHFVPNILGRDGDAYRYPAGSYLEYGPFKERTRDFSGSDRRVASRKRFRSKTSGEEVVDFPTDNSASETSTSGKFLARGKFLVRVVERKDYLGGSNGTKSKE